MYYHFVVGCVMVCKKYTVQYIHKYKNKTGRFVTNVSDVFRSKESLGHQKVTETRRVHHARREILLAGEGCQKITVTLRVNHARHLLNYLRGENL